MGSPFPIVHAEKSFLFCLTKDCRKPYNNKQINTRLTLLQVIGGAMHMLPPTCDGDSVSVLPRCVAVAVGHPFICV